MTEGVENASQVEILRRLGSDEVQGYYFGQPEDAAASVDRVMREMRLLPDSTPVEANQLMGVS